MQTNQVKKTNWPYVLCYVLVPLASGGLGVLIGWQNFREGGTGAVVCFVGIPMAAFLWWTLGGGAIWYFCKRRMLKQLDEADFDRRQIFYAEDCMVSVDMGQAKLALLFFWNPFAPYVVPADRVARTWADEGVVGVGILRGTSRVSFLFEIDGATVRVNTFLSNQRWRMDEDKVLEGISKADMWVQVLDQARIQGAGE